MVYFIPAAILFVTFFIKLLHAQITFTDPIYSGTSCTTEDMGDGCRLNCTGLGFLTADAMSLKTATTMYVTILSSTPIAAVGLGERVGGADVWCKTTNFPATASGKTWASKSLTRLSNCCYNMITMYTSSASTYAAVKPYQAAVIGNTYKWVFTPATTSYTCWQVDISMPYSDGGFTDFTDSPGFVCTSTKSFYYASNIILAPYFELEGSGTTSFYIQSELCSAISDCISCPDSSTCQFCRPRYQVTECGTCTNSTDLTCPLVVDPTDPSDNSTNSTNSTDSSGSTNSTDVTNSTTGDNGSSSPNNSTTGDDGSSSGTNSTTGDDGSSSSNNTTGDDGSSSSNSTTGDDGSSSSNSTTGDDGSSSSNSAIGDNGSSSDTNSTTGDDGSSSNNTTGDDGSSYSNGTNSTDGSGSDDGGSNSTNSTVDSGGDSSNTESNDTTRTDSSGSSDNSDDDDDDATGGSTTGGGESNQETSSGTTTVITSGTGGDYVTKIIALVALVIGLIIACVALLFCKQIIRSLTKKRNHSKDRKNTRKIRPVSSQAELYPSLDLDNVKDRKNMRKIYPSSQAELYPSVDLDNARKSTPRNNTMSISSSLSNIQEDEALFDYTKRSILPRSRVFVKRPLSTIVDEIQEDMSVVVLTK